MRTAALVRQQRPLCHTEAVLLVRNYQPQPCKGNLFLKNRMGAHHQCHAAVRQCFVNLPPFLGTDRAGEQPHRHAQRLQKLLHGVIVLHRQNFRRSHQSTLHAVPGGKIARRRRNRSFPAAHIAL